MKTNFNFKNTKVGDKVYHVALGWVTVNYNDGHGIEINECKMYNMDGREDSKDENPTIYPYNPFEKNSERVVEIFNRGRWVKRVFVAEKSGGVVCWNAAEDFENSKEVTRTTFWETWREIQLPKQLTQEEKINLLWDKFGNDIC